jgi:hypothetical protein
MDREREYDIFEKLPDDSVMWRGSVHGHRNAIERLRELAATSSNEHFAMHTPTKSVVARVNSADPE